MRRDPSDGGPGTEVKMPGYSGDYAMQWLNQITTQCNHGYVDTTTDRPSEALSDRYNGDPIIKLLNVGSGYCLGADPDTSFLAEMKTCDEKNGYFIESSSNTNGFYYIASIDYSENVGTIGWLCGSTVYNDIAYVTNSCTPSSLAERAPANLFHVRRP